MIFYAEDLEQWEDTEDGTWSVSMTPEYHDYEKVFNSKEEFFRWYSGEDIV